MRVLRLAAAGAAVLALTSCGSGAVGAPALQASLAGAFGRLYELQQTQQGQPPPDLASLQTSATCQKGTRADRQAGPGNDWVCQVSFLVAGPGTPVHALYNVDLHPDGCWSADGDGPAAINGARTVVSPDGAVHPDPLYLIDGCLDAG